MAITHKFNSNIADKPGSTLLKPSDWNADHDIVEATNTFTGDGSTTAFTLTETHISSTLKVFINGLLATINTHYTLNGNVVNTVDTLTNTDILTITYLPQ
ncbi:MAG: hypothetical protein ACUZ8H_07060 [Candidatus Anammoxibacter sp.]